MMQRAVFAALLLYLQVTTVTGQGGSKGRPPKYACPQDDGLQYKTYNKS